MSDSIASTDETNEQLEETNAYLARIAYATERTATAARVAAWSTAFLAALVLVSLIVVAVLAIVGVFADDTSIDWGVVSSRSDARWPAASP